MFNFWCGILKEEEKNSIRLKKKIQFNSSGNCDGPRVCESQSENCYPIQGYLKLSWLLQLFLTFLQPNTKRSESSVSAKSASPLDNR